MIYTCNYVRKNSFMKAPRARTKNIEGDITTDKPYQKPSVPGAVRMYTPPISYKTGRMALRIEQKELDELVSAIGLYADDGTPITNAPLNNPNAPFWKHKDLQVMIHASGTNFDDDDPMQKFWLKCFEADPKFKFFGDQLAPSKSAKVDFLVKKVQDEISGNDEEADESYKAMKLLTKNEDNFEKLVSILRAMGTDVRNPNPKVVRQALYRKITDYKNNLVLSTGERNIEAFIRLCSATTTELRIKSLVTEAKSAGIITKDRSNKYMFGQLLLGTSLRKVQDFLEHKDNEDILNEIIDRLEDDNSQ